MASRILVCERCSKPVFTSITAAETRSDLFEGMREVARYEGKAKLVPHRDACYTFDWRSKDASLAQMFKRNGWEYKLSEHASDRERLYFQGIGEHKDLWCVVTYIRKPGQAEKITVQSTQRQIVEAKLRARLEAMHDQERIMRGY